ncbi:formamidopyrimidine-DNA glycosylase [Capronia coronata CBS 617.96]|uniref:Formamidopyrimidine-DNA glycosylase n=1 Tax=Capronia coronata CBS 617.96 TaxID=1182541 RepID=W9Y034_9EURO|nr:formamidopyrimidine-DNA glycosylase [Capronia coronata CBS 617.96]EXJ86182.1 formamidopyrimidine-DNA glycosylase [Capronia coronata CBS 617.96]
MPEIGEVARTVHYIRKLLVGKTIAKVVATDDNNVYGKAGTSAAEFQKHMTGKKVVDAGQQGKYFWMIMSSPPHPVMHFGMSGWLKFKSEHTYYYRPKEGEEDEPWPPKFMKFLLETKPENGEEVIEAAFVDMRRFARIRLVDCPGAEIRNVSPLKENGPDPVVDKDIVTVEWLKEKCRAKRVPIKAMLLDQANISGIGNWVGDEIMYNAKIHPEQYANTLTDEQIAQLHKSIHYVCGTAVELLADSEKFPEDWLFKHRWGKGKKNSSNVLPTGEKIAFLTVGGRTSAVVPSVQKKTGPVAKEMSEAEVLDGEDVQPKKQKSKKRKAAAVEDESEEEEVMPKKTTARAKKAPKTDEQKTKVKPEPEVETKPNGVRKVAKKGKKEQAMSPVTEKKSAGRGKVVAPAAMTNDTSTGRRRSGRLGKS